MTSRSGSARPGCRARWSAPAGGVGIVTDLDFRRRVATGQVGIDAPITALATVPALTIEEDATQASGLLRMIERGVHHLVVVDQRGAAGGRAAGGGPGRSRDPRPAADPLGDRRSPRTSRSWPRRAGCCPRCSSSCATTRVPATHIGAIHAAVVDAAVRRALRLQPHPALDGVRHSWVLLGSLARREPLPLSDVDTALVWADPPARRLRAGPGRRAIRAEAREVLRGLQRCGFTLCANGANAHNPVFSRARSGWIAAARGWQHDPTQDNALLLSAMVADSRPLTDPELGGALSPTIRSHTRTSQFLRALLDEALSWRPPIGFIRDFVVHHSGEHRGQLDLKPGGLAPVVALARWIAIAAGDASGTTIERLHRGAALGLLTTDEADTLAGGFENVYSLLLHHEVQALRADGAADDHVHRAEGAGLAHPPAPARDVPGDRARPGAGGPGVAHPAARMRRTAMRPTAGYRCPCPARKRRGGRPSSASWTWRRPAWTCAATRSSRTAWRS